MTTSPIAFDILDSSSYFSKNFYPEGLSDSEAISSALKVHDYTSIALRFWAEDDDVKKAEWFAENHHGFHPILLGELALVKFAVNPTKETLVEESIPLLNLCRFRLSTDFSFDPAFPLNAYGTLFDAYHQKLSMLVLEKLPNSLNPRHSMKKQFMITAQVTERILEQIAKENLFITGARWLESCSSLHTFKFHYSDEAVYRENFCIQLRQLANTYKRHVTEKKNPV